MPKKLLVRSGLLAAATCVLGADGASAQLPSDSSDIGKIGTVLEWVRARNARDYRIASPNGIDEGRFIQVGGIRQWITIRGEDRTNPVLLVLHGGPGDATNLWSYASLRPWLRHFTVVQWDQRGAGRTFGGNPPVDSSLTIERLVQDGIAVTELIRRDLGQERVLVVAHSFGSILGLSMIRARPDLFSAYVGTGQVADQARNYEVAYRALLDKARASRDSRATAELEAIGPPPYQDGKGFGVQRRWSNFFEGADTFLGSMMGLALASPGYSTRDVNDWLAGQGVSGRLVPQSSAVKKAALSGDYVVPVFVIQGAEDFTTPTSLARELVASIRAPKKEFVTIDGGHFAVFMKSDAFLAVLLNRVRPVLGDHR